MRWRLSVVILLSASILIPAFPAAGSGDPDTFLSVRGRAERGDADAQYNLGVMYDHGEGVPQDSKEAVSWYRKAAEQGNTVAQYNLGVKYENGEGVPQDLKEAVNWYRRAADQGNKWAQYNLGVKCNNGEGVPQDYVQAYMWWNLAAAQGHENARQNRDFLAEQMSPSQLAEGQRQASDFFAR